MGRERTKLPRVSGRLDSVPRHSYHHSLQQLTFTRWIPRSDAGVFRGYDTSRRHLPGATQLMDVPLHQVGLVNIALSPRSLISPSTSATTSRDRCADERERLQAFAASFARHMAAITLACHSTGWLMFSRSNVSPLTANSPQRRVRPDLEQFRIRSAGLRRVRQAPHAGARRYEQKHPYRRLQVQ